MSEAWNQWQGQVIDGKFHLQEYLGGNGQSAVFRTQLPASPDPYSSDARWRGGSKPLAIKLIADSPHAELQLSRWRMAQDLAHPNLLRILDTGRCRLGEIDLIFAVMEHAEENLAQLIRERPLTAQETREMLPPLLDALTWLHRRGLVHGHLKSANIMASNDVLKLSSDGVCPADEPIPSAARLGGDDSAFDSHSGSREFSIASGAARNDVARSGQAITVLTEPDSRNDARSAASASLYDAPETAFGTWTPATDVWSLGVTLAEVLTQHLPSPAENFQEQSSSDAPVRQADPLLPEGIPAEFVEIVRGCIRRDLRLRWTIPVIQARLQEKIAAQSPSPEPPGIELAVTAPAAAVSLVAPQRESGPAGSPDRAAVARDRVQTPSAVVSAGVTQTRVAQPGVPKSSALGVEAPSAVTLFLKRAAVRQKAKAALVASRELSKQATRVLAATWTKTSGTLSPAAARMSTNAAASARRIWARTRSLAPKTGAVDSLLRHFALPAVIASAALVAIYAGMSLRRPVKTSQAQTPVIAATQPQAAPGSRRPSPVSRRSKPNAGQSGQVQPVSVQQPALRSLAEQQGETQQTAVSSAQPAVRHIDDGGADDNEPATAVNLPAADARSDVAVRQRVLPDPSASALATIHGTVRVSVRVQVDQSGNVARTEFASPGPSRYFARLSLEAAQDWKFVPGRAPGPLLLRFEFTRGGVEAYASRPGS